MLNEFPLLPVLLIALGIGLVAYGLLKKSRRQKLIRIGEKAEGVIIERGYEPEPGYMSQGEVKNKVVVRFVTKKDMQWITGKIEGEFTAFYTWQFKVGDKVDVIYNPENPSEFFVETGQSEETVRLVLILFGLGLTFLGMFKVFTAIN